VLLVAPWLMMVLELLLLLAMRLALLLVLLAGVPLAYLVSCCY
jgi:hypothetical protein